MKASFLICLFFCFLNAIAQLEPDYFIVKETVPVDSSASYLIYEDNVLNTRLNGFNNEQKHSVYNYSDNGMPQGLGLTFLGSTLMNASFYNNGILKGTEINCHKDGTLSYIANRDSTGNLHGLLYEFNAEGELSLVYYYECGKMIGLLFNGKNKGFAPPPIELTLSDSAAWRLNLKDDKIGGTQK